MSTIKNGGLDQYGAGPFEQQQFRTAGVEGVNKVKLSSEHLSLSFLWSQNAAAKCDDPALILCVFLQHFLHDVLVHFVMLLVHSVIASVLCCRLSMLGHGQLPVT